jgi:hypothetical protein
LAEVSQLQQEISRIHKKDFTEKPVTTESSNDWQNKHLKNKRWMKTNGYVPYLLFWILQNLKGTDYKRFSYNIWWRGYRRAAQLIMYH